MIEELTELSKNEIIPFSKMTYELREDHICYDESDYSIVIENGRWYFA